MTRTQNRLALRLLVVVVALVTVTGAFAPLAAAQDDGPPVPPHRVYGDVTNDGEPIEGATVEAVHGGEVVATATTDADGYYDMDVEGLSEGDQFAVRVLGASQTLTWSSGSSDRVNFPFQDGELEMPTAAIELDPSVAEPGDEVTLSGGNSSAPGDRSLESFEWTVTDENGTVVHTASGEVATASFEETGDYTVELTVTDSAGASDTASATLRIVEDADEAQPPAGGPIGGGGGGDGDDEEVTYPGDPVTAPIEEDDPYSAGPTVRFDGQTLDEIVFSDEDASGEVTVDEFDELPADLPVLPGRYRLIRLSQVTVPADQRDKPATLRATVSKDRLEELGVSAENVTVFRMPTGGDSWGQLDVEVTETDDAYTLEWETPGFSNFAIASQQAEQTPTPTDTEQATPTDTDEGPSDDDDPGLVLIGFVVLVLLAIAGGAVYYFTQVEQPSG
jgi:hypothetical protein